MIKTQDAASVRDTTGNNASMEIDEMILFDLCKKYLLSSVFQGGFSGDSVMKNPPANAGDASWIPGSERSPGEGNGNPLQYSCLENSMGRGAWRATVLGVAESYTTERLNNNCVPGTVWAPGIHQRTWQTERLALKELCMPGMCWEQRRGLWYEPREGEQMLRSHREVKVAQ